MRDDEYTETIDEQESFSGERYLAYKLERRQAGEEPLSWGSWLLAGEPSRG